MSVRTKQVIGTVIYLVFTGLCLLVGLEWASKL